MPRKKSSHFSKLVKERWEKKKLTEKSGNEEEGQNKADEKSEMNIGIQEVDVSVVESESPTTKSDHTALPKLSFRAQSLLDSTTNEVKTDRNSCEYAIVDVKLLSSLLTGVKCKECDGDNLRFELDALRYGSVHKIILYCEKCENYGLEPKKAETYTSKRVTKGSSRPPFDLNLRLVLAFSELGKGYSGLEKFSMVMNLNVLERNSFDDCTKILNVSCNRVLEKILDECRSEVKKVNDDLQEISDPDGLTDIGVSYDGSWLTRGFKSKHGVGCVIDMATGYVIDASVMSKYCPGCTVAEAKWGKDSPKYEKWIGGHHCQINHSGSSGAMEIAAAEILWRRSTQHGFRYTTMLSDGDSKTFNHLCKLLIYGEGIDLLKEECFNHVRKRLETALRNLVKEWRARKVTLGGRGHGTLKDTTIQKLGTYYKKAMYRNRGNIQAMKDAILATIEHASSTDKNPKHGKCPLGTDSWCFYQAALAKDSVPTAHLKNVGTPLNKVCYEKILPVYERMTDENLLRRCSLGLTQNANESLHSIIWNKCPKETFFSKTRIEIAVAQAVCEFNVGATRTLREIQGEMGLTIGEDSIKIAKRIDLVRTTQSMKQATGKCKEARRIITAAKNKREERLRQVEGVTYGAGQF